MCVFFSTSKEKTGPMHRVCVGANECEAAELKGVVRGLHVVCSSRSYTNNPLRENIYNFLLLHVRIQEFKASSIKTQSHYMSYVISQYIIYCIIFSLYLLFFFQEYKTQLKMAIEDR